MADEFGGVRRQELKPATEVPGASVTIESVRPMAPAATDKFGGVRRPSLTPAAETPAAETPAAETPAAETPAPTAKPTLQLNEPEFNAWYTDLAKKTGIDPNPDDPLHKYDYRAAYQAGAEPSMSPDGSYHWPSQFKADDHPNRYVSTPDGLLDSKSGKMMPSYSTTGGKPEEMKSNVVEQYVNGNMPEEKKPYFQELVKRTLKLAGEAGSNMPKSTYNLLNDIGKVFLHPVDSWNNISRLAFGAVEKLIPGEQGNEALFDQMADHFKEKYGSLEALNKSIATNPASVMMDIASLFTGVGALGKLSKVPALAEVSEAAATMGSAIDPLAITGKTATAIVNKTGETIGKASDAVIGMTTGTSRAMANKARQGESLGIGYTVGKWFGKDVPTSDFVKGMRNGTNAEKIVKTAEDAWSTVKKQRSTEYEAALDTLLDNVDNIQIDISPIRSKVQELMGPRKFNIKRKPDGKLDFSRSTITEADEQAKIANLINEVETWGRQAGDRTPNGVNQLRRRINGYYKKADSHSAPFVLQAEEVAKQTIMDAVPEFADMQKGYTKSSGLIKKLQKEFTLGKDNPSATFKKLTAAMKDDADFGRQLLKELESASGANLADEVAGLQFSYKLPRGAVGRLTGNAALYGGATISPWLFTAAAVTSPRLMGEFLNAAGFSVRQSRKAVANLKKLGAFDARPRQAAYQIGKATNEEEK